MGEVNEKWETVIRLLESIEKNLAVLSGIMTPDHKANPPVDFVHVNFKGAEIYLLHKAFIDAGGTSTENYKSLLEKTVPRICNKTQKGFSAESLTKYSDKVDPEARENVKRFLQRMVRNIDSYD